MSGSDNKIVILIARHGMHLCLSFAPAHVEHLYKSTHMLSSKLCRRNLREVVLSFRQLSSCHAVCTGMGWRLDFRSPGIFGHVVSL